MGVRDSFLPGGTVERFQQSGGVNVLWELYTHIIRVVKKAP
jgi:hypothetical protein